MAELNGVEFAFDVMPIYDELNPFNVSYTIIGEDQLKKQGLYTKENKKLNISQFYIPPSNPSSITSLNKENKREKKIDVRVGLSNAWVISGKYTKSGKPLLAGDPHVSATQPGAFYAAHLKLTNSSAIGFTMPGIPAVLFGRTHYASWSTTTSFAENMDIYRLKLDLDKEMYYHDGRWKKLETRKSIIKVKGSKDIQHTVYATHHGAVLFPNTHAQRFPAPYLNS